MKIYEKIVIGMKTDEVIEEVYEEYHGPIASCGGGKPDVPNMPAPPPPPRMGQDTQDAAANARKAMQSRLKGAQGWKSTIKTGASGLTEKAKTTANKNKLLSGVA
jgi:hypothetical protein